MSAPRAKSTTDSKVSQRVVLPLMLAALGVLVALHVLPHSSLWLERRDRSVLDAFNRAGHKTPARDDIVVLAIDDASLTLSSAWEDDVAASPVLQGMKHPYPWPRRVWAGVIDKLAAAGAKVIFLDLVFAGESADPEDDRLLREALERHRGKVVVGANFSESIIRGGQEETITQLVYPNKTVMGTALPLDGTFGILNFWTDDGIVRRLPLLTYRWKVERGGFHGVPDPEEKPLPAVALTIARKVNVTASSDVRQSERIRFCEPEAYNPLSLHQIFVSDLWKNNFADGAALKDKIVLIGATAPELQDFQPTPLGVLPGIQIHAHALTALLARSFLKDAPPLWTLGTLLLGAMIAWLVVAKLRQPVLALLALWALTVGAVYGCYLVFEKHGVETSPLPLVLALNFCGVVGLAGNFLGQLRETRKLTRFIQRYHSPDRVAHLLKDRANIFSTLGGVERNVTILFSDVRGFTSLSEGMKPAELVTQLNEYLSKMVERVFKFQGSIDKFIGDAVMALWGSLPDEEGREAGSRQHAQLAVGSALAMREGLDELNAAWRDRGIPELRIGVGIHQGPVVVGNIGSAAPYERMELTVIGDSVNLASRLEGLTKDYGVDIIISDAVQQHVRGTHLCRPLDIVKVKGKAIPVKIYAVVGPREGKQEPSWWSELESGLAALRSNDHAAARAFFERCLSHHGDEKLLAKLLAECDKLALER